MSVSDEDRTITDWRTESRLYRRKPGLGWILALVAIPVLLALIGLGTLGGSKKDIDLAVPSVPASATLTVPSGPAMKGPAMTGPAMTGPAMTGPDANAPGASFAPFSILRSGNGFTLAGELPDEDMKKSLIESVNQALPGASVIDNLTVTPGVAPPDFAKLGGLFGASVNIPDFSLNLVGDSITLAGTAPTEDAKAEVEAATADTWPNAKIVNNIQVTAASGTTPPPASPAPATPGGACATLQTDITALLRTPINFTTDGFTLAADSQQLLSQIAQKVKGCPSAKLAVVGHTDNTGNDAINVPLSGNRAKSVADVLISDGIASGEITSRGAGSAEPVAGNDTAAGRAQNRRVEITVS
jgi:peptidoglycan-binding protein ArfA